MKTPRVRFDRVWKKFARGERHDSLRDLIPNAVKRLVGARSDRPLAGEEFWALQDVSFEVGEGEALGIIGRNGAGKSTALKLLTRILKPTRGSCAIVGRSGALIEVAAGFHPDLTGRENVYLQGAVMGMRRADIAARFDEIVDFAGIERFVDTPVKRYSSGMNARLGFSIAAHLNPDVLLIDEVLAVGDMAFQEKCHERMKRFRRDGVAIVFVSHHLPAVVRLCDKVLLLESGAAARMGTPAAVIAEYCSGGRTSASDEAVIGARLRPSSPDEGAGTINVGPGEHVQLEVTVDFRVAVEGTTIGIVVWDLARELYVYGASSDFVGIPPINAGAGERRTFTFTFDTNLTRGLYSVEVNVVDPNGHRFLGVARGICHFHVVEHVSYDGVANLYLAGREGAAVRPLQRAAGGLRVNER